jgi:uncharacterized protein YndB with AHSA1/START domain
MWGSVLGDGRRAAQEGSVPAATTRLVPEPTGRRELRDGVDWVVYPRRLRARPEVVWRALTDPRLLGRWLGTAQRSADGGFRFTFAGGDMLPIDYRLDHVDPGRSFGVTVRDEGAPLPWRVEVDLVLDGCGGTLMTVAQTITNAAVAPSMAAGCEFYLDRLQAYLERGAPVSAGYDDYFLDHAAHYRRMFPLQARRRPA